MTPLAFETKPTLWQDRAVLILVLSNLAILFAALHWQWDVFELMLLYWLETAIIGGFTILKILHTAKFAALFLVPFFCLHFGMFMTIHLTFLFALFGGESAATFFSPFDSLHELTTKLDLLLYPALGLLASHTYSFMHNYLGRAEYRNRPAMYFFGYPYPRIVVMHLTIIIGGFLVQLLSASTGLIVLTLLKTLTDISGHRFAHHHGKAKAGKSAESHIATHLKGRANDLSVYRKRQ